LKTIPDFELYIEGKQPFWPDNLNLIEKMKEISGLDLTAADSHKLSED
jgi:hypothetical protein